MGCPAGGFREMSPFKIALRIKKLKLKVRVIME
jgi:hypothetical protein